MYKTLDDLKKEKGETKPKDKKNTSSYAGGEKSGLAIENPEDIDSIVQRAQNDTREIESGKEKASTNCKITLYSNGFKVDDGQFRDYNAAQNKQFMQELNKGVVPSELRGKYPQGLNVGLEDRRQEEYVPPPPPKYIAFSGTGQSLGGPVVNNYAPASEIDINSIPKPQVNNSKPKTNIQIRLHNGKTVRIELNYDSQVDEILTYVWSCDPYVESFDLVTGFPPKPIKDFNKTIEEADLLESSIIQKINH